MPRMSSARGRKSGGARNREIDANATMIEPASHSDDGTASMNGSGAAAAVGTATACSSASAANGAAPEGYRRGCIMSVRMHDFLTYSDVNFKVGPRLNLVVGPNGTGKSSIVCALALGLGGSPKVLGRSDNLGDFVRHETDEAHVEIRLWAGPNEDFVVRRTFQRRGRSSVWHFNGKKVGEEDIKKRIRTMGVAVDNLCTFLPQDKVGDFSRFTPDKLLLETERTLAPVVLERHQQLIARQNSSRAGVDEEGKIAERLEQMRVENQTRERDVQRMNERQAHVDKLALLKMRRAWLQYETMREEYQALKARREEARQAADAAKGASQPLAQREEQLRAERERRRSQSEGIQRLVGKSKQAKAEAEALCEKAMTEQTARVTAIKNLEQRQQAREAKLATAVKEREAAERRLQEVAATAAGMNDKLRELTPRIDEAAQRRFEARTALDAAERRRSAAHGERRRCDDELKKLKNARAQAVDRIRRKGAKAQSALQFAEWIEQNRDRLQGNVYGPLALHVSVDDADAARCLENHVPIHLWCAFVSECGADHALLQEAARQTMRDASMMFISIEGGRLKDAAANGDRLCDERFQQLQRAGAGLLGFLGDYVQAPDAVVQALRDHANVHVALLGSDQTERAIQSGGLLEEISRRNDGRSGSARIFVPGGGGGYSGGYGGGSGGGGDGVREFQAYTTTTSAYSGKLSTQVYGVPPGSLLARGEDDSAVAAAAAALSTAEAALDACEREVEGLAQQVRAAGAEYDRLEKERNALRTRLGEQARMETKVAAVVAKVEKLEAELAQGGEQERVQHVRRLEAAANMHVKALASLGETQRERVWLEARDMAAKLGFQVARDALERVAAALKKETSKQRDLDVVATQIKDETKALLARVKTMLNDLLRTAPLEEKVGSGADATTQPTALAFKLEALPETIEEVEAMMRESKDAIDGTVHDQEAIQQYEERKKEIAGVAAQLEALRQSKLTAQADLAQMQAAWEGALRPVVSKLDELFKKYMAQMNCGGSVHLRSEVEDPGGDRDGQLLDFKDWGIEIRVRFREGTKLSVLNAQVHSGGERSVSTILFLMALQDINKTSPFRVVDEINQGMDPNNERLVFSRIVRNSCGPGRPQYFLITPKLLQGLTAMEHEDVTVLTIFNGHYLPGHKDKDQRFDFQRFVRKRRGLRESSGDDGPPKKQRMAGEAAA